VLGHYTSNARGGGSTCLVAYFTVRPDGQVAPCHQGVIGAVTWSVAALRVVGSLERDVKPPVKK